MAPSSSPVRPGGSVREAVAQLAAEWGEEHLVDACAALLCGAEPERYAEIAVGLSAHGGSVDGLRAAGWREYWWRTWGARGLLYVWNASASVALVHGVADDHWRPAEMSLKVAARHEVAEAADGAVELSTHGLPRVRAAALRLLGVAGDTEHVDVVAGSLADADEAVRRAAARALERMALRLDLPEDWAH